MTNRQKIQNPFQKDYFLSGEGEGVKANLEKVYILDFFGDTSLSNL